MKLLPSAHPGPRLAVIAILGVLLARPTAAQSTPPTFVQAATFSTGSRVSTVTVTLTRPVAQGDLLVGWVSEYDAPAQVQVSDKNGAWTRGPGSLHFMNDEGDIALYYRENSQAAPGGLTITVTVSSSAPARLPFPDDLREPFSLHRGRGCMLFLRFEPPRGIIELSTE